jgi:hypothetical protein
MMLPSVEAGKRTPMVRTVYLSPGKNFRSERSRGSSRKALALESLAESRCERLRALVEVSDDRLRQW